MPPLQKYPFISTESIVDQQADKIVLHNNSLALKNICNDCFLITAINFLHSMTVIIQVI